MHSDELISLGVKGFSLKTAIFIQTRCFAFLSIAATVIYFLFVLCYLVYDNTPGLAYMIGDAVTKEHREMVIPGWRVLQSVNLFFVGLFVAEVIIHLLAFK